MDCMGPWCGSRTLSGGCGWEAALSLGLNGAILGVTGKPGSGLSATPCVHLSQIAAWPELSPSDC